MPQISPSDVVRLRGARWRVADIRVFEGCRQLTLDRLDSAGEGLTRRFLEPFDVAERVTRRTRPDHVTAARWRRACRAFLAADTPPGGLRCARLAHIDLLPHQLAPALAVVAGVGTRVLLADDVGLGKTIQAGLILSELRALGIAHRILIVTPAGLRDQWAHELRTRFEIAARVLDARSVRQLIADQPVGVNPWVTVPVAIVSVDFVKRPEVLAAARACRWDAVVVDEAHDVAGDNDRHGAVSELAESASHVVLLTATPHSGDRRAFASLCAIGSRSGGGLIAFRRTRTSVSMASARRVRRLHVRLSDAEVRMHDLLAHFADAVRQNHGGNPRRDCWLAITVLHKRALSSARALQLSIGRRLAALNATPEAAAQQLALPLGDASGELDAGDEAPPWSPLLAFHDTARERRLLTALAAAAGTAARRESKIAVLQRLLRRAAEPAVVFTEYRDTLLMLQTRLRVSSAVLHGRLTREERRSALERFASGDVRLLLATDAAGQGLNLQARSRLIVNLELPWNPSRLEQRIGRVDRIGQRRTVHAVHLVARHSAESAVFDRLKRRIATARLDVGAADPLGGDENADEAVVASQVFGQTIADPPAELVAPRNLAVTPSLDQEADIEAARVLSARNRTRAGDAQVAAVAEGLGPMIARARNRRTRARLSGRGLMIWQVVAEDGSGRRIGSTLVAVAADDCVCCDRPEVTAAVERASLAWREHVARVHRRFITCALERAAASARVHAPPSASQPGLFDRRTERALAAAAGLLEDADRDFRERVLALNRGLSISFGPPQLLLVLTP